ATVRSTSVRDLVAGGSHPAASVAQIVADGGENVAERVEAFERGESVDIGDAPTIPAISAAQSRMLHALLRTPGGTDRAESLRFMSLLIGRDIESTKELTRTTRR